MLILHVPASTPAQWLSDTFAGKPEFRLQTVSRIEMALARIAGGGVGAIVLDVTGCSESPDLSALPSLRRQAGRIPIWIAAAEPLVIAGTEKVITGDDAVRLPELLAEGSGFAPGFSAAARTPELFPSKRGTVYAFLGVKGGVGNTTTALHVAAVLSNHRSTVLAELRSDLGALADRVKGSGRRGSIEPLLSIPPQALTRRLVERQLWSPEMQPGLRVLSAPPFLQNRPLLNAEQAKAIVAILSECAELVVLDLSFEAREAARAAAPLADEVVVVLERTPYAMRVAQKATEELVSWGVSRDALGCVVVTRSPVGAPLPLDKLEADLGMPLLAVMPPDADLCAVAESLRRLSFALQPDGLTASTYHDLAEELKKRV